MFTALAVLTFVSEEKSCPDMSIDDSPGVLMFCGKEHQ
jgi:hypothetical protein